MTAISTWPDILNVAMTDYKSFRIQAGATINRGAVLSLDSNGRAVPFPLTGAPTAVIGVAMDSAVANEWISCIYDGVVNVANATTATDIAVGQNVKVATYAGAVVVASTAGTDTNSCGVVLGAAIAGGSYGMILLRLK